MDKTKTIIIAILATVIAVFVILYIIGSQAPKATQAPTTTATTGQQVPTTSSTGQAAQAAEDLTQNFSEASAGYVMSYPADWMFEKPGASWDTVVFSGKEGTDSYRATVNIQNILTKSNGGEYATATELMANLKSQFSKMDTNVKVIDEQPLSYMTKKGQTLNGDQVLVQYSVKGEAFQQWQIVIPSADGKYFHAIAYTAPVSIFTKYLATAQAMIQSWSMNE